MKINVTIYTPHQAIEFLDVRRATPEGSGITILLEGSDAAVHGDRVQTTLPYLISTRD